MDIVKKLSEEFTMRADYAANIVTLLDDGNTIPFIARYRKEMHGACDDQVLREFADRLTYLRNLVKRKEEVQAAIEAQEKWTDELKVALDAAVTLTEVEDIYRPYKQKKKTRNLQAATCLPFALRTLTKKRALPRRRKLSRARKILSPSVFRTTRT